MKPNHFSKRTSWDFDCNSLTTLHTKLQKQNIEIVDLTVSNPTKCCFSFYQKELLDPLVDVQSLAYDPSAHGSLSVRNILAQDLCQGVAFKQIFLTASTSEAYSYLFRLLCNKDDEVLFPSPSYPLFSFLADLNDVKMLYYDLSYDENWGIDFDDLKSKITAKTKAIALVNPNNPTGSYLKSHELEQINALCKEYGLAIICDEVFLNYPIEQGDKNVSLMGNQEVLTFVLNGLSKELALPQMKLAWIAVSGEDGIVKEACQRLEVIADTYLSASAPAQNAFVHWMKKRVDIQNEIKQRISTNYGHLKKVLGGKCVLRTEGGWYAIIQISMQMNEEDFCLKLLEERHVFVHPGYFFDIKEEGCLVLSLLGPEKAFKQGINVILEMSGNS